MAVTIPEKASFCEVFAYRCLCSKNHASEAGATPNELVAPPTALDPRLRSDTRELSAREFPRNFNASPV